MPQEEASIGVARMEADGTLVLDLRASDTNGTLGDARLVFPPAHPEYSNILNHLKGLAPGEEKLVPPWTATQ